MGHEREHRLRVLYISDLHTRGPRATEGWPRRRVIGEAWERNLDDLVKDGIPIDLVCFTSDVADHGPLEEYGPATEFVETTLARLHLPKERFFLLPGNNDIHRRKSQAAWSAPLPSSTRTALGSLPAGHLRTGLRSGGDREAAHWLEGRIQYPGRRFA